MADAENKPALLTNWRHYLKLDTWTLSEALFLLHGLVPPDEAEACGQTRFPEAYQLAVNSCQSGRLGRRITIDESSVYMASPWEWVRWALKKRLRSVPTELRAFYEGNAEGGWLIAAKSPNLAYWRTRQLWSVSEAASLLGGYEPVSISGERDFKRIGPPEARADFEELYTRLKDAIDEEDIHCTERTGWFGHRRCRPSEILRWAKSAESQWSLPGSGARFAIPRELQPLLATKTHKQSERAERYAQVREEVLGAAVAVLRTYPDQCKTGAAVARLIDEKALLFWPDTGEPPISHQKVERLVNKWLRKCQPNGKKRQHSL